MTSAIEITRDLMGGRIGWRLLRERLHLVVAVLLMVELALRWLRRRLAG